jgi:Capsule polysaccharide biosynthesis protein
LKLDSPTAPTRSAALSRAYIFFSVHEELFHRVAEQLHRDGVSSFGGFVWSKHQARLLEGRGVPYESMLVFTRDLLPSCDDGRAPDLAWLARRETELGISINRMLAAERHLLANRTFEQIMRMAEVALRTIAATLDQFQPDFIFTEDISCFHSYAHFALARERGIPFWCIARSRLQYRVSVYSSGLQRWERVERAFAALSARGLSADEERIAQKYVDEFTNKPVRPTGMKTRAKMPRIDRVEVARFVRAARRYFGDPHDPTVSTPLKVIDRRLRRMVRMRLAEASGLWDTPVRGEKYVFYPIHVQPEASTLVQAPFYVDQLALIEDIAKALPIDHRLYVKEHVSSRGRRPHEFYRRVRAIPSVRLMAPDEDTWSLIRQASIVAVITGTVGFEALLFGKPVVTFGEVFFNMLPEVYKAGALPKDAWFETFTRAATMHVPDRRALLALVSALFEGTYPGFIGNPSTFPEALEPDNIANLAAALRAEVGLDLPARRRAAMTD